MDASWARGISLVLFAYFLGSVPFGMLVTPLFDRTADLRKIGSGNIGATNVARAAGKAAGALTLVLDAGKGVFAMALTAMLVADRPDLWLSLVGGAAFLGHVFSMYLHFRGGKGVATAFGVILFLSPATAFILLVLFAAVVHFTRYVSLGSLCAAVAAPLMMALLAPSRHYVTLTLGMMFLLVYTHRDNIRRLFAGEERKFRAGKTQEPGRT
jgi:acyl phosphate:glycerol-3-phosphate acyltransferase